MPALPRRAAEDYPRVEVKSRAELRAWLAKHHATSKGAWIVTYKKGGSEPHVSARDVCEQALCFGWIDSLPRKLDETRSMLLVTPRKPKSNWSAVNKARAEALVAAGEMTPAGQAMIDLARRTGTWDALRDVDARVVPGDLQAAFAKAGPHAARNFEGFPPSAQRGILEWISSAKTPQTRARRVEETATLAERGERALQWRKG
jgi:uncharacterized protein YdeI (YjbR/CyaY-like superfamily)